MKRITVFCGSSLGADVTFKMEAIKLGRTLANENIELVYGGADIGLMGAVANGALESSGKVIGVLPKFLKSKEIAHNGLTELIIVESMHKRKTLMNELCDGIIALPGGFGTLEELFEMLTWGQLGLHEKPIGILNVNGYYNELIQFLDKMVNQGLLNDINRKMLLVSNNIQELITKMKNYQAPTTEKWITKETI